MPTPSRFPRPEVPLRALRTHAQQLALAGEYDLSELEVLLLKAFSYGLTQEEAAEVLGYSYWTIHNYTPKMYPKLKAKTQAQAVANALRAGIIS
jgi:DNA-binding CsgD family transcriptional regulator